MTKKRLTFDIDLPEEETFPAGKVLAPLPRRGPMAAAISENADSLRERQQIEAEIRAENDALAIEHVRLKRLGLITDLVQLDQIETYKLTRDRAKGDDMELAELIASIRDVGLSNPIRLEQREDGKFELIQGYRRLQAYQALLAETGDTDSWGAIPAGIMQRGETMENLYRRMVDENMVRKDISFGEMAMMALNFARDPATKEDDPDRAVAQLFQSAGYSKRSYIRGFIRMMDVLGEHLKFYPHVPRALGLRLSAELEERPELGTIIKADLKGMDNRSVAEEIEVLRHALGLSADDLDDAGPARPKRLPRPTADGKAKTTFQIASRMGAAKCAAANGRLEIRLDRDFSALDRKKLEAAVRSMLDQLA
jgi:ParB family transcriptional regulator, chromosome partitioning protein